MKNSLKKVSLAVLFCLTMGAAVFIAPLSSKADITCVRVNKFRVSGYDSVSGCILHQFFDTYTSASFFISMSDPALNYAHSGYAAYCWPALTTQCPSDPL